MEGPSALLISTSPAVYYPCFPTCIADKLPKPPRLITEIGELICSIAQALLACIRNLFTPTGSAQEHTSIGQAAGAGSQASSLTKKKVTLLLSITGGPPTLAHVGIAETARRYINSNPDLNLEVDDIIFTLADEGYYESKLTEHNDNFRTQTPNDRTDHTFPKFRISRENRVILLQNAVAEARRLHILPSEEVVNIDYDREGLGLRYDHPDLYQVLASRIDRATRELIFVSGEDLCRGGDGRGYWDNKVEKAVVIHRGSNASRPPFPRPWQDPVRAPHYRPERFPIDMNPSFNQYRGLSSSAIQKDALQDNYDKLPDAQSRQIIRESKDAYFSINQSMLEQFRALNASAV